MREYIPDEYVRRVFQETEWAQKLGIQNALFNSDVLKKAMENKILPRWKEHDGYPAERDAQPATQADPDDSDKARMVFFEERARSDSAALTTFMTPLLEPIDWDTICAQKTITDKQVYEWAVYSLASAANIVSKVLGSRENITKSAAGHDRNPRWLAVGNTPNRPTYDMIPLADAFWSSPYIDVGGAPGNGKTSKNPKSKRRRIPREDAPAKKRQLAAKIAILPLPSSMYNSPKEMASAMQGQADSVEVHPDEVSTDAHLALHRAHLHPVSPISKAPEVSTQEERKELPKVPGVFSPPASNPGPHDNHPRSPSPPPNAPSAKTTPIVAPQPIQPANNPTLAASNTEPSTAPTPPRRIKSPNLTTPKVSHWNSRELNGFLTRMRISPENISMLCSYEFPHKGKLTGEVLLTLTNDELNDEKLVIEGPEERKRLWRVVNKLHARVSRNDRVLGVNN